MISKSNYLLYFKRYTTIAIPLLGLAVVALFHAYPTVANELAYEDGVIEYITGGMLIVASFMMFVLFASLFRSKNGYLQPVAALFIATVFLVMGMEEVSWGQRLIGFESTDFFVSNNMQEEVNLHNLNSNLSQTILYIGAFLLLTILPFFHSIAKNILKKLELSTFSLFLPQPWLFSPFVVIAGVTLAAEAVQMQNKLATTMAVITLILWSIYFVRLLYKKTPFTTLLIPVFTLVVSVVLFVTINTLDFNQANLRHSFISEYRELFIAVGVFTYATSLCLISQQSKTPRTTT